MQYLKIERLVIKEITDKEARFLRKKRVFHTISLDLDLTIFDVDKYAPEQIIEFLHFNPPKRKQWLIFLIGFTIFIIVGFIIISIYNTFSNSQKQKQTITTIAPAIQNTGSITTIAPAIQNTGSITTIAPAIQNTGSITTIAPAIGISQKDLDLGFCKKDNESLNLYNDELLNENEELKTKIETIKKDNEEIKANCKKDEFLYFVGKQIKNKCDTTEKEAEIKACSSLINNYFKDE